MNELPAVNTRIRLNVVALSRCAPGTDFQQGLTWLELHQHIRLFWDLQREFVLQNITAEQEEEREYLRTHRIREPDPYLSVCDMQKCILVPDSVFSIVSSNVPILKDESRTSGYEESESTASLVKHDPQSVIVESAIDAKFLVLAAPGTGKTETVLRRLKYLSEHQLQGDLSPVLAVSYSRAAAAELLQRLLQRLESGSVQSIFQAPKIATLDSFAGRVLSIIEFDLSSGSYDDNIRTLALVLEGEHGESVRTKAAVIIKQQIKVVIVDEVQDIVGVRARLIRSILILLRETKCGLVILGDLRQSIYGFNLENAPASEKSMDAFWLVKELYVHHSDVKRIDFVEQHRFSPSCQRLMEQLQNAMDDVTGKLLPGEKPNRARLVEVFEEIPKLDFPIELAGYLTENGSTAILARSNYQVAQLAVACVSVLAENGKTVRVISESTRNMFPGWIGRVFGRIEGVSHYSADSFCTDYQTLVRNSYHEAKTCLEWIATSFGISPRGFQKSEILARLVQSASVPTDLREQVSEGEICISTIHQAKGRQYDTVLIVDPGKLLKGSDEATTAENCRLAYVAATRAKRAVYQCSGIEWLPPIFEWKYPVHFCLDACNDVDSKDWAALQEELWLCYKRHGVVRIYSPNSKNFVLEVGGSKIVDTWPIVLTDRFVKDLEAYALKNLKVSQVLSCTFATQVTGMRTVCTSVPMQRVALIPELSGKIVKGN
ncbi:MAG: UvrD-helicase domain-containing protein [Planctomycetota bacterium]|nr:UvrD-helicase domain-containing protein [Planctomycetota bacterium]